MWYTECTVGTVNADVALKILFKKIYLVFYKCHVYNLIKKAKNKKLLIS